jgi:ectoine hydroxylase
MNPLQHDHYHSRDAAPAGFALRREPVVHGDRPGLLSAAEIARYAADGFLVRHDALGPKEVAALVHAAALAARDADRSRDDVVCEPGSDAVRSIFRVHRDGGPFEQLTRDPRLRLVARQILGSSVYIHQSRLNFKPAFEGKAFPWHSDFETWHAEDGMPAMRALSVSVLLTQNTEHNGPLLVIPGSHHTYVRCAGETPDDHFRQSLRQQRYGVPDERSLCALVESGGIASITGEPGTIVFFDCNLMHGSAGNITPMPRNNLFVVYNSVDNALVAPFCGRPPRPEFLAERPIQPQRG